MIWLLEISNIAVGNLLGRYGVVRSDYGVIMVLTAQENEGYRRRRADAPQEERTLQTLCEHIHFSEVVERTLLARADAPYGGADAPSLLSDSSIFLCSRADALD